MWEIIFSTSLTLEDFKKMNTEEYYETLYAWKDKCERDKKAYEDARNKK